MGYGQQVGLLSIAGGLERQTHGASLTVVMATDLRPTVLRCVAVPSGYVFRTTA